MGKRKQKAAAKSVRARKHWKAYWEKRKKKESEAAEQSGEAGTSSEARGERVAPPPSDSDPVTAASYRDRLLSGKVTAGGDVSEDNALLVISVGRLKELLGTSSCDICGETAQSEIRRNYFDCEIEVKCKNCDLLLCESKPRKAKMGKLTEVNSLLVYHSVSNGYGRAGLSRLSSLFGTSEMSQNVFIRYANTLYSAMGDYYETQQKIVHETVREVHTSQVGVAHNSDAFDVGVAYDGTWMTRGHKSHIQAGFVIEMSTGFVLDFDIISNFCKACSTNKKKKKDDFEAWKETTHAGKCQANFDGLSGRMEAECAVRLWERSQDLGYRYTTFLSDGDSSAYTAVTKLNDGAGPYTVKVVKEECINHVKKRMGTRLRKLKNEKKEEITTKSGKIIKRSALGGKHQLTDTQINAFQRYYGKAIKDSIGTDTLTMKLKIMSGFYHAISRDGEGNYHHNFCDPSWCIYKKALDNKEPMPSHDLMKNYLRVNKKHETLVRKVFLDLSTPSLLERCLQGNTQNRNESLHSKLWIHINKAKFAGLKRVKFMAQLTVLEHNFGYQHNTFIAAIGFPSTSKSVEIRKKMDKARVSPRQPKKKRRKTVPESADYQPGGFDA